MAGFVIATQKGTDKTCVTHTFYIGSPDLTKRIYDAAPHKRVITLQLSGPELAAALWGLENYSNMRERGAVKDG